MPDMKTRENRRHSTALRPYSYYECRIPELYMSVPMHWHSELELIRIKQGGGEFICGGQKVRAKEGEFLLIPPNMLHATYPDGEQRLVYDARSEERRVGKEC